MITILISAISEWNFVKEVLPEMLVQQSPLGEWGHPEGIKQTTTEQVVFFHGGWGKIRAAASTQFVIDSFTPDLVVNIGTCGGFAGDVDVGQILLVEKTIVYDIHERMFDPAQAMDEYSTTLDLDWLKDVPPDVMKALLVSGDSDLDPAQVSMLRQKYGAIAGDWESGAIAYICDRNDVPCLILRGVSDLVSEKQGEAYGSPEVFLTRTRQIMSDLVHCVPFWIEKFNRGKSQNG